MTIQQYREYLKQGNKVECYGMKFKMMGNDYIVIRNNINPNVVSENILINYNHFIDLEVQLSSSIKNLEIKKIRVLKDEYNPHLYVLELDTRDKKKKKEDNRGIGAGMKYV